MQVFFHRSGSYRFALSKQVLLSLQPALLPRRMDAVACLGMPDQEGRLRIVAAPVFPYAGSMRICIAVAAKVRAAVIRADVRAEIAVTFHALGKCIRRPSARS